MSFTNLLLFTIINFAAITLSFILPKRYQALAISGFTIVFLAVFSPLSLIILFSGTFITYFFLKKCTTTACTFQIIFLLTALLFYFKYHSKEWWMLSNRLIPIGLSYYTLKQIHYIFEKYKQTLPLHTFGDYFCYCFFLPTILVGPIHRFPQFKKDLRRRRWDPQKVSMGLERILYGYSKIIILGNYLISLKFQHYITTINNPILKAYLGTCRFWANLYFQFSGYCDITIGLSLIMGFHIIENFNYPFIANNINNFWQRWHISLSQWCRDYVYVPVASFTRKPYLAILAAMFTIGIWHELSIRYLIWGLYHGIGIAIWHRFQSFKKQRVPNINNFWAKKILHYFSVIITINFVIVSYTIISGFLFFLKSIKE